MQGAMPAIHHTTGAQPTIAVESYVLDRSLHEFTPNTILADAPTTLHASIQARQAATAPNQIGIPTLYAGLNSGPPAGEVVGIVLGSVVGFILLVWLFSALSGNNRGSVVDEEEVVVRRSRSPRSKRSRRSEMTSRSPRPERIIRQERIVRDSSRAPPRSSFVVQEDIRPERRMEGDDIVEVIEEGSSVAPPPRRKGRRESSGYRYVDSSQYAGGNHPQQHVE